MPIWHSIWRMRNTRICCVRSGGTFGDLIGHVTIYCRVSTDDQSGEHQERDLPVFAKRTGHKVVAVVKETASWAKNERVERKKVMLSPERGRSTPSSLRSCRAGGAAPRTLAPRMVLPSKSERTSGSTVWA